MTPGRRVETVAELELPGDYTVMRRKRDGAIVALWMNLPRTGTRGRIAAKGHGCAGEPEWEITEEINGTITVSPSIDEKDGGYHGFLQRGEWTDG